MKNKKQKAKLEKPIFNSKEKAILLAIGRHRRSLNINEIAKETGLSWTTVKKYIDRLCEDGLIAIRFLDTGEIYDKKPKYNIDFDTLYGENLDVVD
jgi:DNA-binding MarR family transcriptional regulator